MRLLSVIGAKTKYRAGYRFILTTVVSVGVIITVFPALVSANITEEPNPKWSVAETIKKLLFSVRKGFYDRFGQETGQITKEISNGNADNYTQKTNEYNEKGRLIGTTETIKSNSTPSKETFWSKILTLVTNTYNRLGRTLGFSAAERKREEEKVESKYSEKGKTETYTENSKKETETTTTPINSRDYNDEGEMIGSTEEDVSLTPTSTAESKQRQRPKPVSTSTTTPTPTTQRLQNPTLAPTSAQRR